MKRLREGEEGIGIVVWGWVIGLVVWCLVVTVVIAIFQPGGN